MNDATLWRRLTRGVLKRRQQHDWERFAGADWPARVMDVAVTDRFHAKQGRSTGRLVLRAGDGTLSVYLKRHYRLSWWRGVLAALWPSVSWSPAMQEWEHLQWAEKHGVPVPRAVAVGEYVGPWGRLRSFLAVEELAGMLPLHEAIPRAAATLDTTAFVRWKRGLIAEAARLTRLLHDRRRFHKDLYLCHFYVVPPERGTRDFSGDVRLIDLHRLARHPWAWRIWQVKDLAQLLYSSDVPGVTPRDRLLFWRLYLGEERRSAAARCLRRAVLWKARRYRRHNDKRSPREPDAAARNLQ